MELIIKRGLKEITHNFTNFLFKKCWSSTCTEILHHSHTKLPSLTKKSIVVHHFFVKFLFITKKSTVLWLCLVFYIDQGMPSFTKLFHEDLPIISILGQQPSGILAKQFLSTYHIENINNSRVCSLTWKLNMLNQTIVYFEEIKNKIRTYSMWNCYQVSMNYSRLRKYSFPDSIQKILLLFWVKEERIKKLNMALLK